MVLISRHELGYKSQRVLLRLVRRRDVPNTSILTINHLGHDESTSH